MIQRIQTLFLTIVAGLLIAMVFIPIYRYIDTGIIIRGYNSYIMLTILLVTIVICLTTIFSYKKRIFQMRLCNLNSLILLGFQVFLAVEFFRREPRMLFSISTVFPIAGAILTFIAMRYIARDEALVVASTHLRPSKSGKKRRRH